MIETLNKAAETLLDPEAKKALGAILFVNSRATLNWETTDARNGGKAYIALHDEYYGLYLKVEMEETGDGHFFGQIIYLKKLGEEDEAADKEIFSWAIAANEDIANETLRALAEAVLRELFIRGQKKLS